MSRSYRKVVRAGICCGNNTKYYRTKRKYFRRKAKQQLYSALDDFIHPEKLKQFKDSWEEPTDGTHLVSWDTIKGDIYDLVAGHPYVCLSHINFVVRHYGRYLKPNKYSKKLLKQYNKKKH